MILIDFSPLKAGGGCQLALNFVHNIINGKYDKSELIFLIPDVGPLSQIDRDFTGLQVIKSPSGSLMPRFKFEMFGLKQIYKDYRINLVYTFFGAGLPHPRSVTSIVSVAYPIICYNDSPFWQYAPLKYKLKQKLTNWLRISRLKQADKIIVETVVMQTRLAQQLGIDERDFMIMPPAASQFLVNTYTEPFRYNQLKPVRLLLLSGTARHKNLWRLPAIADALVKYFNNFTFVISVSQSEFENSLNAEELQQFKQHENHFEFLGRIQPDKIQEAYLQADFLLSLSDLESFSNNYMEAWKMGVPLIVSDRDFSRYICQDSACYIEPHRANDAAAKIAECVKDHVNVKNMVEAGYKLFKSLPGNEQKTSDILSTLKGFQT